MRLVSDIQCHSEGIPGLLHVIAAGNAKRAAEAMAIAMSTIAMAMMMGPAAAAAAVASSFVLTDVTAFVGPRWGAEDGRLGGRFHLFCVAEMLLLCCPALPQTRKLLRCAGLL